MGQFQIVPRLPTGVGLAGGGEGFKRTHDAAERLRLSNLWSPWPRTAFADRLPGFGCCFSGFRLYYSRPGMGILA